MKTIAISIDEDLLEAVDRIVGGTRPRGAGRSGRPNRSALIRRAVRDFVSRQDRKGHEERERKILAEHREELNRQLEALVADQAEP